MNNPTPFRSSRERKALLSKYATAAVGLYGVISIREFVDVFNHYEQAMTTKEETTAALYRIAKTDDVEYSLQGEIISGPDFQPCFDDYEEEVAYIRDCQEGKQRYLPEKNEFLRYEDFLYREPDKPYQDLKAHILKHHLTENVEGLDGIDGDLIDLHEMIQSGVHPKDYWDYFMKRGYQLKGIPAVNAFLQKLQDVHKNTRLYENNGFTPSELSGAPGKRSDRS